MIPISAVLNHYKRQEIQQAIIEHAMDKEVAIKFGDNGFGKRPDILQYPNDVLELAKKGATSFHVSEEMWDNPLRLDPSLKRSEAFFEVLSASFLNSIFKSLLVNSVVAKR